MKKALGVDDLSEILKDIPHFSEVLTQNHTFMLYERAYHVFAESERVYKFKEICDNESIDDETKV